MNSIFVNSWAGMVQSGYISINGRQTYVTVRNGTLAEAQLLESGQPMTAQQQKYLDNNYFEGDANSVRGPHPSGTIFTDEMPAFTIEYRPEVAYGTSTKGTAGTAKSFALSTQITSGTALPVSVNAASSPSASTSQRTDNSSASGREGDQLAATSFANIVSRVKQLNAENGEFNFLRGFDDA